MMILRGIRSGLTLALLLGGLAAGVTVNTAAWAQNQSETAKILHKSILDKAYSHTDCRRAIGAVQRRHRIPAQLLSAVALADSGR